MYHHVVYIDPGQPVQDMSIRIHIQESRNISLLRVPALRNDINEIKGIATLVGGRSSPSGITILGPAVVFTAYTLTDLSETDTWHGDSKCYMVQSDGVSKISP
ncbi:hypothetical protein CHS0354_008956 [Potamilus streckersoni]|uniref:Uncharacterized protein n=1 Tax=Potamilus streckersoni TaxID=2493646 RepID=A0AAE0THV9_9BIVA|nr:hypothetical protein CHS0354_008956 [Potamilus streckersoni]